MEFKISKKRLSKILKSYTNPVLVFSNKPLKNKKIITVYTIKEAKKYLQQSKNVNFVSEKISYYFSLLSLFSIKDIRIIKKNKSKIKKINFLTYDQMEILQLYFETIYNNELQYLKRKNISLILNQKKENYLISSFEKISSLDSVQISHSSLIFKGNISKKKINEILEKCGTNCKKVKVRPNFLKIKVSSPFKVFSLFIRSYL